MENHHFRPSWAYPSPRTVKINFDGAMDIRHKCGSITVVIKNEIRQIIGQNCKRILDIINPTIIEAMAPIETAQLALQYQSSRI